MAAVVVDSGDWQRGSDEGHLSAGRTPAPQRYAKFLPFAYARRRWFSLMSVTYSLISEPPFRTTSLHLLRKFRLVSASNVSLSRVHFV